MSILEAMAIDVSTIATPAGETPQLINDGVDGFLVTGEKKSFSVGLSNFLGSPELRKDMDLSARNKICSSFDINLLCC